MHYVYILRCANDSFYVGSAQDLNSRVKAHNDGRGAPSQIPNTVPNIESPGTVPGAQR
ncbi:MAG: GIY-YIG nuclease family protein [Candidatus Binatia bacterium]